MPVKLRRLLRLLVAECVHRCGLLRIRRGLRRKILDQPEVCVLGFHRVLSQQEFPQSKSLAGIVMKEVTFRKMLEYLSRNFQLESLETVLEGKAKEVGGPKPCCVLTFDDGWRDNYTTAFPWLKKLGLPATIFLIAGLTENRDFLWPELVSGALADPAQRTDMQRQLASLLHDQGQEAGLEGVIEYLKHMPAERRQEILSQLVPSERRCHLQNQVDQMMNWDQVAEMSREGIDFGAHTVTHPLLTHENDADLEFELQAAKEILEKRLGREIRALAYPNGDWDERVRGRVEAAGYESAFTTQSGWHRPGEDRFTIPRILIHEGNVTGWGGEFSPAMLSLTLLGL